MRCLKLCMCVERNESPDTVPEGAWWLWSGVETRLDVSGLGTGVARTTGRLLLNMKKENLLHIVHAQFSRLGIQVSLAIYVCLSGLWLGGLLYLYFLSVSLKIVCYAHVCTCTCIIIQCTWCMYKQIDVRVPG